MHDILLDYFRRRRALEIRRYKAANLWVQRWTARDHALHYSKLIRMMEARHEHSA